MWKKPLIFWVSAAVLTLAVKQTIAPTESKPLTSPVAIAASPTVRPNGSISPTPVIPTNHTNIITSWFQGGTPAGAGDEGTSNVDSYWYKDWRTHLAKDNTYYFALPCPDISSDTQAPLSANLTLARAAGLQFPDIKTGQTAFKNQWLAVSFGTKTVYVQWEDIGPLAPRVNDDCSYVFGSTRPTQEDPRSKNQIDSALDLSPAAFKYLTNGNLSVGLIKTNWRFLNGQPVPAGPWSTQITTSGTDL